MNWLQFCISCEQQNVETWSDALLEAGAATVSVEEAQEQAIFEITPEHKPMWDKVKLIALFTEEHDPLIIQHILAQQIPSTAIASGTWSGLEDENWVLKSQQLMQPMQFAEKLWVCPSWCEIPDPNAINIILDPEMAFGTGANPTTALCLEWIVQNLQPNATVVDFGCGSGILGIAAVKFGAKKIYAIDIDPLCIDTSIKNAHNNQIDGAQFVTLLPEQVAAENIKADVIVANILANTLKELAPIIADLLKVNGKLVMSGILHEQASGIQQCYAQWFENFTIQQREDWVLVTAVRNAFDNYVNI